jgi:hypothetical protein
MRDGVRETYLRIRTIVIELPLDLVKYFRKTDDLATLKALEKEIQKGLDEILKELNEKFTRTLIGFEDTQDWVSNTKPNYPKLDSLQKIELSGEFLLCFLPDYLNFN